MSGGPLITRRQALGGAGALTIAFALPLGAGAAWGQGRLPGSLGGNPQLDAWLRIGADGTVTVFTGKVELGQGIATALSQIAADELDVDIGRLRMVTADTELTPNEGYTFGSLSIQQSGTALRFAAAEARAILLELAAARLPAKRDRLSVKDGVISSGQESVTYWELIGTKTLHRQASGKISPKRPGERRYAGKPMPRRDIPPKVFGEESFLQDIKLPGMLHGRVVHPPDPGAELTSLDEKAVQSLPGVVRVVRDGRFLGVIAKKEYQAVEAARALTKAAKWKPGPALPASDRIADYVLSQKAETSVIKDASVPEIAAVASHAARYTRAFQAHASIGPSAAIAHFEGDKLTLWTHSQGIFPLRGALAKFLRVREESIHIIHAAGAGCYGQNGADDAALEAVLLARAVKGRPLRLQWMRDDEFRWEPYGSAMVIDIAAKIGQGSELNDWRLEVRGFPHTARPGGGIGNLAAARLLANPVEPPPPFNIPQPTGGLDRNAVSPYTSEGHVVTEHFIPKGPLRTSALRGLGSYANVFAIESFMDELAALAGEDPVAFRLHNLRDARGRAVIEEAAKRSDWGAPRKPGSGQGIGYSRYKNLGGYLAVVAEVFVNFETGEILVQRATAAVDCGEIINPDGVKNQIEGGIIQSTSWTLLEKVSFDESGFHSIDWIGYPILTMDKVPEVEVHLMNRPAERPFGAGELAQGPMAAAIANAVSNATGGRVRDLPMTPERVLAAMA